MLSQLIGPPHRADCRHSVGTAGRTKLPKATIWYVQQLIEQYLRDHPNTSNARFAELIGHSKQHIGDVRNGRVNPGTDIAIAVAKLFGRTLDELQADASRAFEAEFADTANSTLERPERYPNRAAVLSLLRADLDPEVVTRVESRALASPVDPPKLWWIRTVLQEQEAVRLERENPLAVAASRSESEALSDEVNRKIEERRANAAKPSKGTKGSGGSR